MSDRVYFRRLPGGGYVAVEITRVRRWFRKSYHRGIVLVERRSDNGGDRTQHPLVVAEASGESAESVLRTLLPAAECNPAIGSALLKRTPVALAARPIGLRASPERAQASART